MKKKVLVTIAMVGMTLVACSDKDSYQSVSPTGGVGGSGDLTGSSLSVEEKALVILDKDTAFKSTYNNVLSQNLKASFLGAEVKSMVMQTENTDISVMQHTILDGNSSNCSPIQFNTQSYTSEALMKGVRVNSNYRIQCIESDCNNILFFSEKYITAGPQSQESAVASVVTRLSKDENGIYKPVASESNLFADVQTINEAINKCVTIQTAPAAHSISAITRNSSETNVDADTRRLYQITRDIGVLQSQLRSSTNALGRQTIQMEIDTLNSERLEIQRRLQEKAALAHRQQVEGYELYGSTRAESDNDVRASIRQENIDRYGARLAEIDSELNKLNEELVSLNGHWHWTVEERKRATETIPSEIALLVEERMNVVNNIVSQ